jgi:hypothetical protein
LPKYSIYHNADCISKWTIKRIGALGANLPPTGTFQFMGYIATNSYVAINEYILLSMGKIPL